MTLEEIIYQAAADGMINEWQADELVARINSAAKTEVSPALGARCFIEEDGGWQLGKLARSREDGGLFRIAGITLALMLFCFSAFGQSFEKVETPKPRLNLPAEEVLRPKDAALWGIGCGLSMLSGMAYGVHEVVDNRPHLIPDDWNKQWWDQRQSWTNKYKNNDPGAGRRLIPVAFTDADHFFSSASRWTGTGAGIVIGININRRAKSRMPVKQQIANAAVDALINAAFFQVGFLAAYKTDLIFH